MVTNKCCEVINYNGPLADDCAKKIGLLMFIFILTHFPTASMPNRCIARVSSCWSHNVISLIINGIPIS